MAKGGGGSWKVAYADFVTAMMAFFLVMWIGAQDVKVRQSVANYFVDPSGVNKRPVTAGAILEVPAPGPVAGETKVDGGRGLQQPSNGSAPSPGTAVVMNWVSEPRQAERWRSEARRCLADANARRAVNDARPPDDIAAAALAGLLSAEASGGIPDNTPDVYKDLLYRSFKDVNWDQVARSLLTK